MISTFKRFKPLLNWLVIIMIGIVSGREIYQYLHDNSQTHRIESLQKAIVLNLINNISASDDNSSELHQNISEIISHARDKTKCMYAIEDELIALKRIVNDDRDVNSINVSTMHTETQTESTSSAQALIKKYVEILTESCK